MAERSFRKREDFRRPYSLDRERLPDAARIFTGDVRPLVLR